MTAPYPCETCQNHAGTVKFYYAHSSFHGQQVEDHVYVACPHHSYEPLPNGPWQIVSVHPLTVTPSVHWADCGCHGFITAGQWVSLPERAA